jgi:calcium-dependent protein kinase
VERLSKINIDSLKNFQHHQKLKQAALTAIAVHLNPKDVKQLKDTFKALDKNGDGCLTLDELRHGLSEVKNGEEILALMQAADTDKSGTINYTEFIAATMDAQIFMREENLRNAFMIFDTDQSGKIDAKEIKALLEGEEFQDQIEHDKLKAVVDEVDTNGDGEIDFEEFLTMMRNIKPS